MKVVAHRGYSALYGDNNLVSIQKAIECRSFDALEIDIQLDECNEIILKHDQIIHESSEKVYFLEFLENVHVPEEMKIFLDIKGSSSIVPILETILKYRDDIDRFVICSFNIKVLKKFKLPLTQCFTTCNILREEDLKNIIDSRIKYIFIEWNSLEHEMVNYCWNIGLQVYTFTLRDRKELTHALKFRVDGIIVNEQLDLIN